MQINNKLIFLICFFEGASVMAVELISAKLIAPWFGTSLYVWTSVLGVTMMALALGYLVGGILSVQKSIRILFLLLIISSVLIALMPFSGNLVMGSLQYYDVRFGSLISALVFLFPPLFALGTVSPVIVALCDTAKKPGRVAGLVFAISTIGGVLSVLAVGFYLLPQLGLMTSTQIFSTVMASSLVVALLYQKSVTVKKVN